jgi:hypothetical protein
MCHWSSYEYERRLRADPTRSFFQAVRELFRRKPTPRVEAPVTEAEVIPLRAESRGKADADVRERADAA